MQSFHFRENRVDNYYEHVRNFKILCHYLNFLNKVVINSTVVEVITLIVKVIDSPTQTPLCGLAVAAHEPLKFCPDEQCTKVKDS